jgi:hypothetical protein
MFRSESYCDGRLIKQIEQVNVGGAETNFLDHYVDGRYEWLLDGRSVTPTEAEAFRRVWQADLPG